MLKNIFYAFLLGVGMAACLSENSSENTTETKQVPEQTTAITDANAVATPAPEHFVIRKGGVGNIEIGMPIDDVRTNVTPGFTIADTTLMQEGQASTAYNLQVKDQAKGILIEQLCNNACEVWRIHVKGSDFKTATGIGAGSKYSEVQQHYPIQTVNLADGGLVAVSQEAGMSFVLDQTQMTTAQLRHLTPSSIPANTIVKSILVY